MEFIKKLPENINCYSQEQICRIVKNFIESSEKKFNIFFETLDKIPENKNTLTILALKALIAEKIQREWPHFISFVIVEGMKV